MNCTKCGRELNTAGQCACNTTGIYQPVTSPPIVIKAQEVILLEKILAILEKIERKYLMDW